jgi:hypothetical protein
MSDFSPRRRPGSFLTRTSVPLHAACVSVGAHMLRLRITISGRHPHALSLVDARLVDLLQPHGITRWISERRLTLVRLSTPITPAEWSAVIGWLLCQPEVLFVARELPLTRLSDDQAR